MQAITIAVQGLQTVTHVLFARLFGAAVFGSYQTCLAILEMLTRGGTGGADKGIYRYLAAYRATGDAQSAQRALGTALRVGVGLGSTLAVLLVVLSGPIARLTHTEPFITALRVMAPAIALTGTVYVLINASLAAKVTYANFVVRGVAEPVLLMTAGLVAALLGRDLVHLATAHVIAAASTFLVAVLVVRRVFGRGEIARAVGSPGLPGFARYSTPLGAAELVNAILQRADIVLLAKFVGPTAAAVYAATEFITRIISNARYVFDAVAAPVFSEAIHLGQNDRLRYNLHLIGRWVATAAVPIAVTVVALRHDLLSLYGPAFPVGANALLLLAAGHLVNATLGLTGSVLTVGGWSRLMLGNNVAGAVVNIGLALVLIPRYGMVGTAVAAFASVSVMSVLMLIEVRTVYGIYPVGWSTAKPLLAGVAALAAELAVAGHIRHVALRIPAAIIVGLASYLGALVVLRLPAEDRRLLANTWARLRGRPS
jgi:O-antigen/teichoic acid export membrane protein